MAELKINEPSSEILDDVLQSLGLADHIDKKKIKGQLRAHANAFSMHRAIEGKLPTIHQDTARMRGVAKDIEALRKKIDGLHPLIYGGLGFSYSEHNTRVTSLKDLERDLDTLKSIAENFGAAKFATKQPDDVLRNAVGGLMLLIEAYTGKRASVQKRSSDYGTPPELSSPEAKAIGTLLRVGQSDLLDTTLVNVISAVRREGDNYKEKYAFQLILGAAVTAF